jgi:phospholipid/cholesterol/gamma-HCH transport system substrate-binding protein
MSSIEFPEPKRKPAIVRALTNKLYLSALGVFLVFVVAVAYVISGVLGTPLTSRPKSVKVELSTTGGLYEGAPVTYRGVHVGKITKITFTATGVQAIADITTGTAIPADTRAVVRSLSPVGEQYLDFQPKTDKGPYLKNGATIAAANTSTPQTLASTVVAVNKLLVQIDPDKLHSVLDAASEAFSGTSSDLSRLTDQSRALISDLNKYWPNASRLARNAGTLLDIGASNSARLQQTARDFRQFAAFLKGYNPELLSTLKSSPEEIAQLHQIVKDASTVMPSFLRLGGDVSTLIGSYAPHLKVLLSTFAPGLGVLGQAVKDNSLQLDLIGQADHNCDYPNKRLDPKTTTRRPLNGSFSCPNSFKWNQRGASHAPGPVK